MDDEKVKRTRFEGQGVKLLMLKDYLYSHSSETYPVTVSDIQKYFEEEDMHADRKTIYADIKRLKEGMNIEVHRKVFQKEGARATGYYVDPLFEPNELRMIVDSIQASKYMTEKEADDLAKKVRSLTDLNTAKSLNRKAYVGDRVRSQHKSMAKNTDTIYQAMEANNQVAFKYVHYTAGIGIETAKKYSKSGDLWYVSPFALYWSEGSYYLYAYIDEKKGFRYFRIDRMENVSIPLGMKREGNGLFNASSLKSKKQAKIFKMYGGKEYKVRLQAINPLADAIIDEFGKDVTLVPIDKNHFTVDVLVEVSPTFFSWIFGFGKRIRITHPSDVVDQYKNYVKKVYDMYFEEGK